MLHHFSLLTYCIVHAALGPVLNRTEHSKVPGTAARVMKGTEHFLYKDRLNTQGLFCLEKRQLRGILEISIIMLWRRPTAFTAPNL